MPRNNAVIMPVMVYKITMATAVVDVPPPPDEPELLLLKAFAPAVDDMLDAIVTTGAAVDSLDVELDVDVDVDVVEFELRLFKTARADDAVKTVNTLE